MYPMTLSPSIVGNIAPKCMIKFIRFQTKVSYESELRTYLDVLGINIKMIRKQEPKP